MAENLNNLPAKVTATATFYNTTGIIEKGKNIYFSPFLTNLTSIQVREKWLSLFNAQAFKDTDFTDFNLSGWLPEDRTLRITANIAQFRARGGYYPNVDTALNYIIIKETYWSESQGVYTETGHQYYGYFIDSAKQAGRGSVELSVSPDNFTNVFFLQNTESLSGSTPYDVFNPVLKETYVERQHYDRVSATTNSQEIEVTGDQDSEGVSQEVIRRDVVFKFKLEEHDYYDPENIRVSVTAGQFPEQWFVPIIDKEIVEIGGEHYLYATTIGTSAFSQFTFSYQINVTDYSLEETNLPIFSQIEENFKFKRQYRDLHTALNNGLFITEEEKEIIKTYNSAQSLKSDYGELYIKLLRECCYFVTVVFKDNRSILSKTEDTSATPSITNKPDIKNVGRTRYQGMRLEDSLAKVDFIVHICPDYVSSALKADIDYVFNHIVGWVRYYPLTSGGEASVLFTQKVVNEYQVIQQETKSFYVSEAGIRYILSNANMYSDEIATAYLHKESSLLRHMTFNDTSGTLENIAIEFKVPYAKTPVGSSDKYDVANNLDIPYICCFTCIDIFNHYQTGISEEGQVDILNLIKKNYFCYRFTTNNSNQAILESVYVSNSSLPDTDNLFTGVGFLECYSKTVNFPVDLTDDNIPDLSSNYYDPVLTFSPYSFYSLSYLAQTEVALNKQNYYQNPVVRFYLTVDSLDSYKFSIIPEYEVEGNKIKYFSESMSLTLTNNLTVASSKLLDYLIANQAQMKNQYAVNEKEAEKGFIEAGVMAGVGIASTVALMSNPYTAGIGAFMGVMTGLSTGAKVASSVANTGIGFGYDQEETAMNQKAKMADVGKQPSNVKQLGTNINIDLGSKELAIYLNHYRIDQVSYETICKYLERFGYSTNLFTNLNVYNRIGWNYIRLKNLDFNVYISQEQEDAVREIFLNGVTLLHNPNMLHNEAHNYEYILKDLYSE